MHSILFSLTKRDESSQEINNWHNVVTEVERFAKSGSEIEPLGKGCWLLIGPGALLFLANGIREADTNSIAYRVLIIQEATDWPSPVAEKQTP